MAEIPKVLVLKPLTPSAASVQAEQLRYDNLYPAVEKYAPGELKRQQLFWDSEPNSIEEQQTASQLALQYMLMNAARLNIEGITDAAKQRWSDHYTDSTSEIYDIPETSLANKLIADQSGLLIRRSQRQSVDNDLINHFSHLCNVFGIIPEAKGESEMMFAEPARVVGEYFEQTFTNVFSALDLENAPAQIQPAELADRFEAALPVLAADHDAEWSEWKIIRDNAKDSIAVEAGKKQIIVGMNRANASPLETKGLFGHEALIHAQRAINGTKISKQFGFGLPGYLDAEEGLGVFVEYALTGVIPDKNIDRYVDIALALGQIDGKKHTRAELIDFAMSRAFLRNVSRSQDEQQSFEDIVNGVYAHVNRIYRGSLGNEFVGVYTKDIAYHKGFMSIGNYITDQLENGTTTADTVKFLLRGKFDPTNEKHLAILSRQG